MRTSSSQRMMLATPLLEVQTALVLVLDQWRACPDCPTARAVEAAVLGAGGLQTLALVTLPVLVLLGICAALFFVGWRWPGRERTMAVSRAAAAQRTPVVITKSELYELEMQRARQHAVLVMQHRAAAALTFAPAEEAPSDARPEGLLEGSTEREVGAERTRRFAMGTGALEVASGSTVREGDRLARDAAAETKLLVVALGGTLREAAVRGEATDDGARAKEWPPGARPPGNAEREGSGGNEERAVMAVGERATGKVAMAAVE